MMITAKATLLKLPQAAQEYKIPEEELNILIEDGNLEFYDLDDDGQCVRLIAADDIAAIAAEKFVKRENFKHLEGVPISMSEAGLRYHFHTGQLSKWVDQGHIQVLEKDPTRTMLNEADVAFARALADLKGTKRGSSLFK